MGMTPDKPNPIEWIRRNLGITQKQAEVLMPPGVNSFPAAVVDPYAEEESWAVREYRKDNKGWERIGSINDQ